MLYKETKYGFDWGAAQITRGFSDERQGWVTLILETPKYTKNGGMQIYVTKTGKVRVYDSQGEWLPKKKVSSRPRE